MSFQTFSAAGPAVCLGMILIALPCGGISVSSCSEHLNPTPAPNLITFTVHNLYPENMQYDATKNRFLVSSVTTGNIGQVSDDGTYTVFASGTSSSGNRFINSATGVYSTVVGRTRTDTYVLFSHLDQLKQVPPVATYGIGRVLF